jgi:chemotaxis methyl-accepting protein methylase
MPKLIATSTILEHELSELRLLVERQTGVVLDCPNSALASHVADYVEAQHLGSSATLLERLRSPDEDPSTLPSLLDGLLNNNTGFFRHQGALNALTRQVVPQLCARKSTDGPSPLRIWSAGCSTGEETYSIAMAICDGLSHMGAAAANLGHGSSHGHGNGNGKSAARNAAIADSPSTSSPNSAVGLPIHIVGSDLLPQNIETADRGIYRQSALDGLPPATIRNYFSKINSPVVAPTEVNDEIEDESRSQSALESRNSQSRNSRSGNGQFRNSPLRTGTLNPFQTAPANGAHLLVKPRLRSLVTFNCMNLARPGYIGRFDCIFCMDVLPHFSRAQRIALLERLHLYLEPGGYLFLSQTEKLATSNLNFRSETFDGYTFHRKPLAASAAYGR